MILTALAIALCPAQGVRITCVHDGDSIVVERERIRIVEIDAPELEGKCASERQQALAARDRLQQLLSAGPIAVQRTGTDRYKRTLARITVNGRNVGEQLIAEGYVRAYAGGRRPWC